MYPVDILAAFNTGLHMFRNALAIAQKYTMPVVLSRMAVNGDCSSSIGTFVVVNDEGWFVTAGHILEQFVKLAGEVQRAEGIEAQRQSLEQDQSITDKVRRGRLAKLQRLKNTDTKRCSAWWGVNTNHAVQAFDIRFIPSVDIGVGRLQPFDPAWIATYPIFKDPSKDIMHGASLCKLGFPFHGITPAWNVGVGNFELPAGAVPLPFFPMEGIFTRDVNLQVASGPVPPFPLKLIETSTPGLRGQSGGPIFDSQGVIWGIQSNTAHLPLGFTPQAPGGKKGQIEHQFLNVGRSVHVETILGFFKEIGISYSISSH